MKIGLGELLIVLAAALIIIGPDKLPQYARKLGEALSQFRKASKEATDEIRKSVAEPLDEMQKPLREAVEPLKEAEREMEQDMKDLQSSFRDIGKEKPKPPEAAPEKKEEETAQ